MKVNLDYLIGSVQDRFYAIDDYHQKYHGYSWIPNVNRLDYERYERDAYLGRLYIIDLCRALRFNINHMYALARAIRKWEERHNWERCFPVEEHAEQILCYLQERV